MGRLSVAGLGLTDHGKKARRLPAPALWALVVAGVGALVLAALFVVSLTPAFTVTSIEADPSDHLTAENISKLAVVSDGTTLLNVDTAGIADRISKNPWVASVRVSRQYPDTLHISIEERSVFAIVTVSSGNVAWYLSDAGTWIEPVNLGGGSTNLVDAALAKATEEGCLLIRDVPQTVEPKAGSPTTDPSILGVIDYQKGFSEGLASQVVSYSASSEEAISCSLKSGVEISLGDPSQIPSKEAVINELMAEHPNQLTYINVRNPAKPSFRRVSSDSVVPGSGVAAPSAQPDAASAGTAGGAADGAAQGQGSGEGSQGAGNQAAKDSTSS